jgi:hypothetical protein
MTRELTEASRTPLSDRGVCPADIQCQGEFFEPPRHVTTLNRFAASVKTWTRNGASSHRSPSRQVTGHQVVKSTSNSHRTTSKPSDKPNFDLEPDSEPEIDRGVKPNIEPNSLRLFAVNPMSLCGTSIERMFSCETLSFV